jgi:hypothetical protein
MLNNTTTVVATVTRYITRKDCPCGAGRTSALCVGAPAQSKDGGPVFIGVAGCYLNDTCVACKGCGINRRAEAVRGRFSAKHKCNAKCLASKGPTCECSCGGKNHGASYGA